MAEEKATVGQEGESEGEGEKYDPSRPVELRTVQEEKDFLARLFGGEKLVGHDGIYL